MASFTPFVADEEQVPTDPVSSSESDNEPASTVNWSRRLAAGLAACTATYAVGRAAVHGIALDSGVATSADSHGAAPAQHPVLRAMQDDDYEPTFETSHSGAEHYYSKQAGELRKGAYIMIKGHACKVSELTTSKTGKHGHAKAYIVGLDIFTGKKFEDIVPAGHNVMVPSVKKTEYQLIDAEAETGEVSVIKESGDTKDDLKLPDESDDDKKISKEIVDAIDAGKDVVVLVQSAIGLEKIVGWKSDAMSAMRTD